MRGGSEEFIPVTISDRTAELAGRAVALHEANVGEAREVLEVLGLWERLRETRGLPPDDIPEEAAS